MFKSYAVHYMNKFPGSEVTFSDDRLDVRQDGVHRIALRKGGNGQVMDAGKEVGATDVHDLSPIPKEARVMKLYADGTIRPSEEAKERREAAHKLAVDGKILSIEEAAKV